MPREKVEALQVEDRACPAGLGLGSPGRPPARFSAWGLPVL